MSNTIWFLTWMPILRDVVNELLMKYWYKKNIYSTSTGKLFRDFLENWGPIKLIFISQATPIKTSWMKKQRNLAYQQKNGTRKRNFSVLHTYWRYSNGKMFLLVFEITITSMILEHYALYSISLWVGISNPPPRLSSLYYVCYCKIVVPFHIPLWQSEISSLG